MEPFYTFLEILKKNSKYLFFKKTKSNICVFINNNNFYFMSDAKIKDVRNFK